MTSDTSPRVSHHGLDNHFLIAMPALSDPNFSRTVTYLCEHNEDGAMGLVINRPLEITLDEIFKHMGIGDADPVVAAAPIYLGGPVQPDRGFVLHTPIGAWESTLRVTDDIGVTTSQDVLKAMAEGKGPEHALVALGYAGWGTGQLEAEIIDNAWLSVPAESDIIFHLPSEQRWRAAAASLGIDLDRLSSDAGHA
ncbi:MAG: YqgE/AlgH family protein [Gammaproteobacteria bacterium]|nr:YqgE/AlgH family protein [Gammaproteobacteria bacterium]MCP5136212.1 YqgE/AlgH family protein [Gammaproteobacteria bacterium]